MTDHDVGVETAGGVLGGLAGKTKQAAGSLLGDAELAREGRLQQAQVQAEADARREDIAARQRQAEIETEAAKTENGLERERLRSELEAHERESAIARDRQRAEREVEAQVRRDQAVAAADRRATDAGAMVIEQAAQTNHRAGAQEAASLEDEARQAEMTADRIDPEEH